MKPSRVEVALAAFSLTSVLVVGLNSLGWLPWIRLPGSLRIGLYPLYSCAAAAGWLLGNLYVRRSVLVERRWRFSLGLFYLLAPVGPFFLFRSMAPLAQQVAAPLVPWFCAGIVSVFFMVPVSLRPRVPARRPKIGGASANSRADDAGSGAENDADGSRSHD